MRNACKTDWVKYRERIRALFLLPCFIVLLACILTTKTYIPAKSPGKVALNEICSNNYNVIKNAEGKWRDYIELYNRSKEAVNLKDYSLAVGKSPKNRTPLIDKTLQPGEYALIFLTGEDTPGEGTVPLKINARTGENVYLYDQDGALADLVTVPPLSYNTVYARDTDGNGSWRRSSPTPGEDNGTGTPVSAETLRSPVFSHTSGFYNEAFLLTIKAQPGTEIYYTLDGSMPDENSLHYTAPILIDDSSENPNVYASRKDVSSVFLTQEIALYADDEPPFFNVPDSPVDKCTIVRAVCIGAGGAKSPAVTQSYFVGFQEKSGYDNLAVVSLVTEPENLFDAEKGIYVLGERFQNAKEEGLSEQWIWWPANYFPNGREWERPAFVSFFSENRELSYEKLIGLELKGVSSRIYPQKSFRLHARKELDNEDTLNAVFWGQDYQTSSISLFSGGNDYHTKLKDYLMYALTGNYDFSPAGYTPCALFLDGEYWGVYYITEDYNEAFFEQYYDISPENLTLIKNRHVKYGAQDAYETFEALMVFVSNNDLSLPENYEALCTKIDIRSYIEYIAAHTLISHHTDWPQNNFSVWKASRQTDESAKNPYADGRWRYLSFDVNSENAAMESSLADVNMFPILEKYEYFYPALIKNTDFKKQFALTLQDMMNLDFSMDRVNQAIDAYLALMEEPMAKHYDRYFGANDGTFQQEVEDIRLFFENRPACLLRHMKESGLAEGELSELTLQLNDAEGGKILLNGKEVPLENGIWKGQYYTDYPVTLKAVPETGYRFAGWEGDADLTDPQTEIDLPEEGVCLKAVFEKLP